MRIFFSSYIQASILKVIPRTIMHAVIYRKRISHWNVPIKFLSFNQHPVLLLWKNIELYIRFRRTKSNALYTVYCKTLHLPQIRQMPRLSIILFLNAVLLLNLFRLRILKRKADGWMLSVLQTLKNQNRTNSLQIQIAFLHEKMQKIFPIQTS